MFTILYTEHCKHVARWRKTIFLRSTRRNTAPCPAGGESASIYHAVSHLRGISGARDAHTTQPELNLLRALGTTNHHEY